MARVFVVGAAVPNGGTYMAYHLGQIVHSLFGFEPIAVRVNNEKWDYEKHSYPTEFPMLSVDDMERFISAEDVLIANPSFSNFMFGLRLPGKKICYVQGFNTFALLDARFDLYVSVSDFVKAFLAHTYGIVTTVVPPFLESHDIGAPIAWRERSRGKVLVYLKGSMSRVFLYRLRELVSSDIDLSNVVEAMSLPRRELLGRIAAHRYLLNLSAAEGFGLVPLEAMSLGSVVLGFDGFGGRQYFRSGRNCFVSAYPDIEGVAQQLRNVIDNDSMAEAVVYHAIESASDYTYERFCRAWVPLIEELLARS